jgi:hypothetical protein
MHPKCVVPETNGAFSYRGTVALPEICSAVILKMYVCPWTLPSRVAKVPVDKWSTSRPTIHHACDVRDEHDKIRCVAMLLGDKLHPAVHICVEYVNRDGGEIKHDHVTYCSNCSMVLCRKKKLFNGYWQEYFTSSWEDRNMSHHLE